MKQHLVVIAGNKAYRYEGSRRIEEAEIQWEEQTISQHKAMIEDFRKNGLPPPIIQPADLAFNRVAVELQCKRPIEGLSDQELLSLWNSDIDAHGRLGAYCAEDVFRQLEQRGIRVPRS